MKLIPSLLAGFLFVHSFPAVAGDLDPNFNSNAALNGAVLSTVALSNGQVLVGGAFTSVSGVVRGGIARLNSNASLDNTFLNGLPGANSYVWSVGLQPDGKILLAGFFTTVNGVSRNGIARLNSNGSLDTSFLSSQAGANGAVYCILRQPDSKVLVAGDFTSINGTPQNYLARLNSDGSLDTSFLSGMTGANSAVFCLTLQADGKILMGGWFTAVNGVSRLHLARLNTDGSIDASFLNGVEGPLGRVWSIAVQTNDQVLIGGDFDSINGVRRDRLARLNSDGALDTSFLSYGGGVSDDVWAIALQPDGKILVGGQFGFLLGAERNCLARLDADGNVDSSFLSGEYGPNDVVRSLFVQPDGKILLGGQFTEVNQVPSDYIARLMTTALPQMSNVRYIDGQFSFDIAGEAGRPVVIQASSDLQQWVPLATNVLSPTPFTFSDPESLFVKNRLYRLLTQ